VILDLVESRPFYIYGDVSKGGAYPYRAGLTVRHAVAVAGGLLAARSDTATISPAASAELRARYKTLSAEYVRQQIRVASLRAELEGKREIDLSALNAAAKMQDTVVELIDLETQY